MYAFAWPLSIIRQTSMSTRNSLLLQPFHNLSFIPVGHFQHAVGDFPMSWMCHAPSSRITRAWNANRASLLYHLMKNTSWLSTPIARISAIKVLSSAAQSLPSTDIYLDHGADPARGQFQPRDLKPKHPHSPES